MKMFARSIVVALLAACPAVTVVHAQDRPSSQDSFWLGSRPLQVWTGRVREADGKWTPVTPAKEYAQQLRKQLAAIQVSIDVDRKFEEARTKLNELAMRATLRDYDDRSAVLVEVALARAALLQKLGDSKAASDATKSVLLNGNPVETFPTFEFTEANDADTTLDATAIQDARLVALRKKLKPNASSSPQGPSNDVIDNLIAQGLEGNQDVIRQLGARAAPALSRRILLEGLDRLLDENRDPLYILMGLDRRFAAEFILSNFDKGGDVWKTRVLHCLSSLPPFEPNLSDWTYDTANPYNPPKLDSPWMPLIERLLEEKSLMPDVAFIAEHIAFGDALTPRLQKAYINYLLGPDPANARAVADCFPYIVGRSTTTPILEAGLSSTNASIRASSAQWLLKLPRSDALLASAKSTDPVVRSAVASALQPRRAMRLYFKAKEMPRIDENDFVPVLGAPERALLVQLAGDTEGSVRREAAKASVALRAPLDPEVYARLASDPDRDVRIAMLASTELSRAASAKLCLEFAADTDPLVLEKVDVLLIRSIVGTAQAKVSGEFDMIFWPAIKARYANKARDFDLRYSPVSLFSAIASSATGLEALIELAAEDDPVKLGVANSILGFIRDRIHNSGQRSQYDPAAVGLAIDGESWKKLLMLITRGDAARGYELSMLLIALKADYSGTFFPLAEDGQQPPRLRLQALDIAAPQDSKRTLAILQTLLGVLPSQEGDAKSANDDRATVLSIGRTLKDPACSPALLTIVTDTRVPDWAINQLISGVARDEKSWTSSLSEELSNALLARWRSSSTREALNVVWVALENVAKRPRTKQGDWLILAAQSLDTSDTALRLMGDLRDPTYLDVLAEALNGKGISPLNGPSSALETLTRYLDDNAAEIILKAAGSAANPDLRKRCFEALDQIRKYQDEKSRWAARKTSQQAKDEAVRELVKLLDDADASVRAQSARSIATLGAIDQLPKLVTMLKDKDANVRKAAQDALDALNAVTTKKD